MIYVGRFNEDDLKNGVDKETVSLAKEKHNLDYTNTKTIIKSGKAVAIDIWVCGSNEFNI